MQIPFLSPDCRQPALLNGRVDGAWQRWSAAEVRDQVRRMGLGLRALGLRPGESVGILAASSPHWVMMDLAIQTAGGVSVPLFADVSPENLEYEMRDSGMRLLFAATRHDLERARPHAGMLAGIITRAATDSGDARGGILSWADALKRGDLLAASGAAGPWPELSPDALATIVYTSGSTGYPKGVMLTRGNFEAQLRDVEAHFPLAPATDVILSVLPLAHVFERMAMYDYLRAGVPVYFAEDAKRLGELLREVRPTVITVVPRLLERVQARMVASAEVMPGPRGRLGRLALRAALRRDPDAARGLDPGHRLHDLLVYARLRRALGGRLRYMICGGSALSLPVARFFRNLGLPLYEGYGMTECSPVITANTPGRSRLGTVGHPFASVEIAIAEDGEILARGPNVMIGYLNRERETRDALGDDGWLRTGDLGEIDADGYLSIRGRKKELFKTSTGEYVSPVPLEAALCEHPLIDAAVVIAEGRKFASCLLVPDFDRLPAFRASHGLDGGEEIGVEDLLRHPAFVAEIARAVEAAGAGRNPWERLRKFRILGEGFSIERGEMTPTLKVCRQVVEARYAKEIGEMYEES